MRRQLLETTVLALLTLMPGWARAQELLTNGGLELEFPDFGGRDSSPPGWTTEEGPPVNAGFPPPDDGLLLRAS